ncbi:MAG: pseudaminic acid synthase [Candidatus ainarchaeum sp.]|nr:pseudaminic acid synthase [Candidatus ainarchaeum sp.]
MEIKISGRKIGPKEKVFIIAEISANHCQNYEIAEKTIIAAKEAGADAIKMQTYTPDTITMDCGSSLFQIKHGSAWDGKTLYSLYKEAYTPWEWQPKLKKLAESLGMAWFSTPFDRTAADFLEKINVPAYKIASQEINDLPLIEYIAKKGKPVLLSTGIATLKEIKEAVQACKKAGNRQIAVLKCTSEYPAAFEDINLKTIPDLEKKFGTVMGISDHTLGEAVPIAGIALGARIIEKHFILDKKIGGPDASFSMEARDFAGMVQSIREAEKALGKVTYKLNARIKKNRDFRRSLFASKDIKKGEKFSQENVRSIRPGFGLEPKFFRKLIGKKAKKEIKKCTPLSWKLVEK